MLVELAGILECQPLVDVAEAWKDMSALLTHVAEVGRVALKFKQVKTACLDVPAIQAAGMISISVTMPVALLVFTRVDVRFATLVEVAEMVTLAEAVVDHTVAVAAVLAIVHQDF